MNKPTISIMTCDVELALHAIEANLSSCQCDRHKATNAIGRFAALARAFVRDAVEYGYTGMTAETSDRLIEYPLSVTVREGPWKGSISLNRTQDVEAVIKESFRESTTSHQGRKRSSGDIEYSKDGGGTTSC